MGETVKHPIRIFGTIIFVMIAILHIRMVLGEEKNPVSENKGDYIVVFQDSVKKPASLAKDLAKAHRFHVSHTYTAAIKGFSASIPDAAVKALEKNPNVASIEVDRERFHPVEQTTPSGVNRIGTPAAYAGGHTGNGVSVAVIDSGVDLTHPDLVGNIDTSLSNTFITKGKTTVGGDDDHGHGTHVAGTIAAVDNFIDVIGVAPQASIVSLKVLKKNGFGSDSDIIAAVDFITAHNNSQSEYANIIHVANMSLGGPGNDGPSALHTAIANCVSSGTVFCVAAGNESDDAANHEPAAYDEVITVSAIDPVTNTFASFSNFGADVDIAGPGVNTLSTAMGGGITTKSGTSMATPHVTGTVAQYIGANMTNLSIEWAVNKAGVASIAQTALVSAGECAGGSHGSSCNTPWTGDTDGLNESLVDVDYLLGLPQLQAVNVAVSTEKSSYDINTDNAVSISVIPTDENGNVISGLDNGAFVTKLNGDPIVNTNYSETGTGLYECSIQLPVPGNHTLIVEVTDNRSVTGSGSSSFTVTDSQANPVMFVERIDYRLSGRNGRDLMIDVTVVDTNGNQIEGARVDISVTLNSVLFGTGSGATTNTSGIATYKVRNAPNGCYLTTVTALSKNAMVWNSAMDAADTGFCK